MLEIFKPEKLKSPIGSWMDKNYRRASSLNLTNVLDLVEPNPKARFIDLGCDDGSWTMEVANRIGTKDISGVEVVEERAALARSKGITVEKADLEKMLPYPDYSFDVVHSNFVIEHLADIDHFVMECHRLLKPGGYTVLTTENGSSWHNIFAAILGWQTFSSSCCSIKAKGVGNPLGLHRGLDNVVESQRHKFIFNYLGLKEMFEIHGFVNVEILGAGYHPLPAGLGKIDPRHAHFLALKARKPIIGGLIEGIRDL
jgi:ubiquinone/menaquinone biosynthesis C-methylase UbiE